jgi:mono/diheme cytochrome c family protein
MSEKIRLAAWFAALSASIGAATILAGNAQVTTAYSGEALYLANCANCHGTYAEGSGPIAADLTKTPPDLRHLAAANGGVFPRERVIDIIDGRVIVAAHGASEMPVWGRAFTTLDTDSKSAAEAEANTQAEIAVLADFLASVQQQ